jgi:UDP-2-acetamido-3-amino-2,3-dideoxy-glucuronate N-acetyltransferase
MQSSIPQVAVIGSGYWGKNLVRNYHELGALRWVCDTRDEALSEVRKQYHVQTTRQIEQVLADPEVKGVVIAAPAAQHFEIAKQALLSKKDVYVEKPLALHARDGKELVELATGLNRILMVGHILEYHPAILKLKKLICDGELGKIRYIYSTRLNLGKLRTEENILWSFAPHDLSAILFLLEEMPSRISTHGSGYIDSKIADTTLTTCDFDSGVQAHIFVSWLHPFKEQKLAIVGDKQMAVFDDTQPERKLVLFSHRIDWLDRRPVATKEEGKVILLPNDEPLRKESEHFLECIRTRQIPRTDGQNGVRVLQLLEGCEQSLSKHGQPVDVGSVEVNYYAHPSAVVDKGAEIGMQTKIWHFSHVMAGSKIGTNCNLGQNVVISPGVKVGNNVKIQNNVSVYTGVELQDNVFCGPSMVFTNVINPRSHIVRKHEYKRTLVKEGASIGANATIVCGVTLGKYCFIAAGAVVTRDVPDYSVVIGVPATHAGWMCYCGLRLLVNDRHAKCAECRRTYLIEAGRCIELAAPPDLFALPEVILPDALAA